MFEELKLKSIPPTELALEIRIGRPIPNEIALPPAQHQLDKYRNMRAKHPNWVHRRAACGTYNCYGHNFASRRTAIYDDEKDTVLKMILEDDRYVRIALRDAVPGDLALYRAESTGVVHIGQIVEVGTPDGQTRLSPIWVISKWDDGTGEDRHLIHDVPFRFDGEIEIWTDRH